MHLQSGNIHFLPLAEVFIGFPIVTPLDRAPNKKATKVSCLPLRPKDFLIFYVVLIILRRWGLSNNLLPRKRHSRLCDLNLYTAHLRSRLCNLHAITPDNHKARWGYECFWDLSFFMVSSWRRASLSRGRFIAFLVSIRASRFKTGS